MDLQPASAVVPADDSLVSSAERVIIQFIFDRGQVQFDAYDKVVLDQGHGYGP